MINFNKNKSNFKVKNQAHSFWKDKSANISIMGAFLMVPLIGIVAFAIELGNFHAKRIENQALADMAAYAGALDYSSARDEDRARQVAIDVIEAAGLTASNLNLSIVSPFGSDAVRANISTVAPFILARIIGSSGALDVSVSATVSVGGATDNCIIALRNSGGPSVAIRGGSRVDTQGCGVSANSDITINGGSIFRGTNLTSTDSINVQGGSSAQTSPVNDNLAENVGSEVQDPFRDFDPLRMRFDQIGLARAPINVSVPTGDDFDLPSQFGSPVVTSFNFQGNIITKVGNTWFAPAGTYNIRRLLVTEFGDRLVFQGTSSSPSTVTISTDTNLGFGMVVNFEHVNIISTGAFTINGGDAISLGDGDVTFSRISVTGTSRIAMGNGDLNITSQGLNVGGSSNFIIGNGEKRIAGNITVGGQARLELGDGRIDIRGNVTTQGNSDLAFGAAGSVFINGNFSGGAAGRVNFNDADFFIDGNLQFNPSSRVTTDNVSFFTSGRIDIAAANGSEFNTPEFNGMLDIEQIIFATTSTQRTQINNGGNIEISGVIYTPNSSLDVTGGGQVNGNNNCLLVVAEDVTIRNGARLNGSCTNLPSEFSGASNDLQLIL